MQRSVIHGGLGLARGIVTAPLSPIFPEAHHLTFLQQPAFITERLITEKIVTEKIITGMSQTKISDRDRYHIEAGQKHTHTYNPDHPYLPAGTAG